MVGWRRKGRSIYVVTIGGQQERSLGKKTGTQQINRSGVGTVGCCMAGLKNRRGVV